MADQALEQELLALEKRHRQAQKGKDGAAAAELTDEACLIAGAQGVVEIDRRTLVGKMEDASWRIEDHSIGDDVHLRQLDADTAILAYKVHGISPWTVSRCRSMPPTPPHGSGVTTACCVGCTPSRSPVTPSAAIERPRLSRAEVEGEGGLG